MSSGAGVNVLIGLGLSPIVSRMYTKEEFGIYYLYLSIITIGGLLINGTYNQAFVVPRKEEDFLALLGFCLKASVLLSLVFLGFILLLGNQFLILINASEIGNWMYALPLGLLLTSFLLSFQNWNVRRKEFKRNALSSVAMSSSDRGGQILIGLAKGVEYSSLIISKLLSDLIAIVFLWRSEMKGDLIKGWQAPWNSIQKNLKEYIKYPKFVLTGRFMNRLSSDLPLYLFSASFGLKTAGAFGFAIAMLNVPFKVIGGSISTVYFQRATELFHKDKKLLQEFSQSSFMKMTILGSLAFGFVFAFGDVLFNVVFGEEWNLAGRIARILSVFYIFRIVNSPFSTVLRSVRKEEYGLYLNIGLAASRIFGIWIGIQTGSIIYAVICFSLGNIVGYIYSNYLVFKSQELSYFRVFFKSTGFIVLIFGLFYLLRLLIFPYLKTLIY